MKIRHDHELTEEELDRIDQLKVTPWIGYQKAIAIRQKMDALVRHPRIHRMPNIALIGDSNNGKTTLLRNFCKKHNPPIDLNAEKFTLPILMIQTPPTASEGALYYAILTRLSAAGSPREPEASKVSRIITILKHLDTRVLILDDLFNIASGNPSKRRQFLNALRNLSIELSLPMIVSGTPETLNILSIDVSISNRFKPYYLPRWQFEKDDEQFARFVRSVEESLKLKQRCQIMDEDSLHKLTILSEGLLGEVVAVMQLLAETAIRNQSETITPQDLTVQNLKSLGWVMPSDRSRHLG